MRRKFLRVIPALTLVIGAVAGPNGFAAELVGPSGVPIEVRGERIEYDRDSGWITARDNVVITRGGEELRADHVQLNTLTEKATAVGNVTLKRDGEVWHFDRLDHDFGNKTFEVSGIAGQADPFRVEADRIEKTETVYILHRARVTTCALDASHRHYYVRAKEIRLLPGCYMKAWNAVWYFGRVPVLYIPFWRRDLREQYGFHFFPGYNSRVGAFALSSYRYPLNETFSGETHFDYRTQRGVAVGQDIRWRDRDRQRWIGDLRVYYADDKRPIDSDEDAATSDIDNERWRVRLRHHYGLTESDYILLNAHWLSDTDILEDFFEGEYRRSNQPDNYLSYTHWEDAFTAGILFRKRLNDFYSRTERLPELSLSVLRQEIGAGFYYESQNAATYLQQVWADDLDAEDYSAFRVDSAHMFYRPFKVSWLNLVPRAGWRGTYYSKSLNDLGEEGGGELRGLLELGQEVSFKAFKQWQTRAGRPLRHVIEPYANYTFSPDPNIDPEQLYQFDDVDGLDEQHWTLFGVRNKLQTKREKQPFDLVDLNVSTIYNIRREEGQDALEYVYMDAELRPMPRVWVDLDGVYSLTDSELDSFNTQIGTRYRDVCLVGMEHLYRRDASSLISSDVTLWPGRPWEFNAFGRYEFEDGRVEEIGGHVQHKMDCLAIRTNFSLLPGYTRTDGSQREDEWRAGLELWLTAFPRARLGARYRN